jgi:hypothetical protein
VCFIKGRANHNFVLHPIIRVQIRGRVPGVPGCAGTCAGLFVCKLLIINNVPLCRVYTPPAGASAGRAASRPAAGPPALEAPALAGHAKP